MKVISGLYKGRNIDGFDIDGTRPTMDRVKESLFATIQNYIPDSIVLDLFSGSGIVSRYFKKYSNHLITNDLEGYSYTLNECYLANKSDINITMLERYYSKLQDGLKELKPGFITELYAPSNDNNIKAGESFLYYS